MPKLLRDPREASGRGERQVIGELPCNKGLGGFLMRGLGGRGLLTRIYWFPVGVILKVIIVDPDWVS